MWASGNTLKLTPGVLEELKLKHGIDDNSWVIDADTDKIYVLRGGGSKNNSKNA